jgi:hypothetical protein
MPSNLPGKRQIYVDPPDLFVDVPKKGAKFTFGEDINTDAGRIVKERCPDGTNIDSCSGEFETLLQSAYLGKRFEMILGENKALVLLNTLVHLIIQGIRGWSYSSKYATFRLDEELILSIRSMKDGPDLAMAIPGVNFEFQTMTTAVKLGPSPAPEIK